MHSTDRFLFAIAMAVLGVTTVASADLITKNITGLVSLWQMLWLRSLLALLILWPLLAISGQLPRVRAVSRTHLIVRSLLMAVSYLLFFSGLAALPMAVVAGGFFSTPFFTLLLAWWLLREPVGVWRLSSVVVGFIGVLLVLRPDASTADTTLFLPVMGAFFYSLTQIYTRKYCKNENALAVSSWLALCFMLVGLIGVLSLEFIPSLRGTEFYSLTFQPLSRAAWLWFVVIAVMSLVTHFALAAAYQNAPATVVGPLEYLYLPIAAIGGFTFFNETPEDSAIVGIGLILLVGGVITWREQRLRKLSTNR